MNKLLLGAAALTIAFTSCKKYDEGPALQLTSRDERMANTWVIQQATEDDRDVTSEYDQYELYMTNDGDAELNAEYNYFGATLVADTDGTWTFYNEDENVEFDYEDNDFDKNYQILKLTQDELWMREVGADVELRFRTK